MSSDIGGGSNRKGRSMSPERIAISAAGQLAQATSRAHSTSGTRRTIRISHIQSIQGPECAVSRSWHSHSSFW